MFDKKKLILKAEDVRTLMKIMRSKREAEDLGLHTIYDMILERAVIGGEKVNVSFLARSEAKELLDSGFRLYDADGTNQYTKPDAFLHDFEVRIEW